MPKAFQFSKSEGFYRYKESSRKVSDRQVYAWVESAVTEVGNDLERLAIQLQKGEISREEWALAAGREIRDIHRAVAFIANGGKANMTASTNGFLGSRVRQELAYFNAFANEIGNLPEGAELTDAFVSRAKSYYHAAYTTYAQALRRRMIASGQRLSERNILEAGAEHCQGCLDATDAGVVPIGTLVAVGARECGGRCKCRIVYFKEAAA